MKELQSKNYNEWPKNIETMDEYDWFHFINTSFYGIEFRQPFVLGNDIYSGVANLKIFWIDKDCTIGYGVSSQYIDDEMMIENIKIGREEDWQRYKNTLYTING